MSTPHARLIQGPVGPTLARLAVPMFFGILGLVGFNLADTWFVGQLGKDELAALTFTFPVVFTLNGVALGLGSGTSAVISRAIGRGDRDEVRRLATHALILGVVVVAGFALGGELLMHPMFLYMGADPHLMPLIEAYMRIWFAGTVFVVVPMIGNHAIRATGDTLTPSLIMIWAMVANIILDPLLIFGIGPFPRMELAGAAIATVLTRATTLVLALSILHWREHLLCPSLTGLWRSWKEVLYIGVPAAATRVVLPAGAGVITLLVSGYGAATVAGYGVATRIEAFALAVFMALASGLGPFVGQNRGAGLLDRVKKSIWLSQRFAVVWGAAMWGLLALLAPQIAGLFNDDPAVVQAVSTYLRLAAAGWGMQGVLWLSNESLNVLRRPLHAAVLSVLQMFGLYIPLAWLGSSLFELQGLFSAAAVANVCVGALAFWWLRGVLKQGG